MRLHQYSGCIIPETKYKLRKKKKKTKIILSELGQTSKIKLLKKQLVAANCSLC